MRITQSIVAASVLPAMLMLSAPGSADPAAPSVETPVIETPVIEAPALNDHAGFAPSQGTHSPQEPSVQQEQPGSHDHPQQRNDLDTIF